MRKLHRSYLFVPGDRPERFDKAYASNADAVVLDLEDAVPEERKEVARSNVAAWLSADRPVFVRVNAVDTRWIDGDLAAIARAGLAGVMVPKTGSPGDVSYVAQRLGTAAVILPLIETASGVLRAYDIACQENVLRLAFGSIDFQVETGIQGDDVELLFARSQLVLASRAAGVQPPVDGVTTSTGDESRILEETRRACRLGFAGKLCIHPAQLNAIHAGFQPREEDVQWARGVLDAVTAGGSGAISYQGKMVDRPVVERAKQILERCN